MEKLFAIVDMGTTNTRLTLADSSGKVHVSVRKEFGVKDRASTGSREILIRGLNQLFEESIRSARISKNQIQAMLCSGMITSEIGIAEIPHLTTPVTLRDLAANVQEVIMPEVASIPLLFIPGVKNRVQHASRDTLEEMDFMRGEEIQTLGAVELFQVELPVTFMFLSSHTKMVDVNEDACITRSFTTLSGQIFNALRFQTFLASSISKKDPSSIHPESLFRGVRAGLKSGILRSALMVRFMDVLMQSSFDERFAFLEGIIISSDIQAIQNSYPFLRKRIFILGDQVRSEAYIMAFKTFLDPHLECIYLGEDSLDRATIHGALRVANLRFKTHDDDQGAKVTHGFHGR
jgi:2-dehydro-3-deoxygalactonokinase